MNTKIVLVGPYSVARRYAVRRHYHDDDYVIVTRAHQLHGLDPHLIQQIITVDLCALSRRVADELRDELDRLRSLWPVPTLAAA